MQYIPAIPDFSRYIETQLGGKNRIYLMVEGMSCASCAWQIENELNAYDNVKARINFSTRRLSLEWQGTLDRVYELLPQIQKLGFKFLPFDIRQMQSKDMQEQRFLLKCMAIAGFAAGNIMLLSFALWFTDPATMGPATRSLLHWLSALIALPTVIYSGQPFFHSAFRSLRDKRANMDVPISLAIILASAMSLFETINGGMHVYFDSAVMLVFLLLIGRYLDKKARGHARAAAQDLLHLMQGTATVKIGDSSKLMLSHDLEPGMILMIAAGERIAADGIVIHGESQIDQSLITGETMPQSIGIDSQVFAGTINLAQPIMVRVTAAAENSLLSDIIKLMENAEQGQAKYVRLADRISGYYTPAVHILALASFAGWVVYGLAWQPALMIATTVLIITCPCALALAVPAVQVVASQKLFKQGMLLKSADALERLAKVNTIVFDKTGVLTRGQPDLINKNEIQDENFLLASSMAAQSKHPLSKALAAQGPKNILPLQVKEIPGQGLEAEWNSQVMRLGKAEWCGIAPILDGAAMELWFSRTGSAPVRFLFADQLRTDAANVVADLWKQGFRILLLSGDRKPVTEKIAQELNIKDYKSALSPVEKSAIVQDLIDQGQTVLMIGDGLNDAPALAGASVSMSPSSAMDITQNAADIVFQGDRLEPVVDAVKIAHTTRRLVNQNFALSFLYNIVAIPVAVTGQVTPLLAATLMSASSILVVLNALRLGWAKK